MKFSIATEISPLGRDEQHEADQQQQDVGELEELLLADVLLDDLAQDVRHNGDGDADAHGEHHVTREMPLRESEQGIQKVQDGPQRGKRGAELLLVLHLLG